MGLIEWELRWERPIILLSSICMSHGMDHSCGHVNSVAFRTDENSPVIQDVFVTSFRPLDVLRR